nr:MAG: hypothetical protein [Owegonang virus 17]
MLGGAGRSLRSRYLASALELDGVRRVDAPAIRDGVAKHVANPVGGSGPVENAVALAIDLDSLSVVVRHPRHALRDDRKQAGAGGGAANRHSRDGGERLREGAGHAAEASASGLAGSCHRENGSVVLVRKGHERRDAEGAHRLGVRAGRILVVVTALPTTDRVNGNPAAGDLGNAEVLEEGTVLRHVLELVEAVREEDAEVGVIRLRVGGGVGRADSKVVDVVRLNLGGPDNGLAVVKGHIRGALEGVDAGLTCCVEPLGSRTANRAPRHASTRFATRATSAYTTATITSHCCCGESFKRSKNSSDEV